MQDVSETNYAPEIHYASLTRLIQPTGAQHFKLMNTQSIELVIVVGQNFNQLLVGLAVNIQSKLFNGHLSHLWGRRWREGVELDTKG